MNIRLRSDFGEFIRLRRTKRCVDEEAAVTIILRGTIAGVVVAALASAPSFADTTKNLGAQPSRDQLIEMLVPHNGVQPQERGLRVRSANPTGAEPAAAPSTAATPSSAASPAHTASSSASRERRAVALDVKFGFNSAELTPEAKDTIRRLGAAFQSEQLASYRFRVEGHTDASGRPDYNLALSRKRAEAVREYLINDLHVAPNRLEIVGRGQQDPADPADPLSAANRRVEVVNLGQ
jgi:OmpA-OmpF porin, OOP family